MKTCVVIPTYNESCNIASVVGKVRAQHIDVVVVDDGSTDDTSKIAQDNGAVVLRNEHNYGKGISLTKGFQYALERGFEAVITMDGDGQHLAEEIPYFLRLAEYSDTGIIIGNRMSKHRGMPYTRVLTNNFMSWIISVVCGQDIPDSQCGFRLLKKGLLEKLKLRTAKFETESEMLMQASRLGFKIESAPITTIYNGETSRINPFVDTVRFARYIFKEMFRNNFKF
jgi:glycosyltransferase involved in cell wall biosynthesis